MKEFENIVKTEIGRLMKREREIKGFSIRTLARKVKIERRKIKKWEQGKGSPPLYILSKIFKYYGKKAIYNLAELDIELQFLKNEIRTNKLI